MISRLRRAGLGAALAVVLSAPGLSAAETVRFGVDVYTTGSQIWVARDQGFFEKNGIDAQITAFATGIEAIDALLIGRADMAVGLDFPIVSRIQNGKLTVLAGVFHSAPGFHKLVVSSDIKGPQDLVGKTIGVATGTAEHLITMRYLELNGIAPDQVEIVGFTSLLEIVASLRSGRIDAAFTWADGTEKATEGGAHYVLVDDSAANRSASAYLAASSDFLKAHPDAAVGVLKAMHEASEFIKANPDQAAEIIAKGTRAPAETVRKLISFNEFGTALTDYERKGFEEVAEFIRKTRDVSVSFETGVDPSYLEKAVPGAVQLGN